jgi:hypothetical protein
MASLYSGILNIGRKELNLISCLRGGMSFRWKQIITVNEKTNEMCGVIGRRVYFLKQNEEKSNIEYKVYSFNKSSENEVKIFKKYLF